MCKYHVSYFASNNQSYGSKMIFGSQLLILGSDEIDEDDIKEMQSIIKENNPNLIDSTVAIITWNKLANKG